MIQKERGGSEEDKETTEPGEEADEEDWGWLKNALDSIVPRTKIGAR